MWSATRSQSQFVSQGRITSLNQDGISSDSQATDVNFLGASGDVTILALGKRLAVDDNPFARGVIGSALEFQPPERIFGGWWYRFWEKGVGSIYLEKDRLCDFTIHSLRNAGQGGRSCLRNSQDERCRKKAKDNGGC